MGVSDTHDLAHRVASGLKPGAVLALYGDLGSGKTCFVKGMANALDVQQPVNSPTYTLINEYYGRLPVYHVDLYRILNEQDALNAGLDEYLYGSGVTVIEWADRAESVLPPHALHVRFSYGREKNERVITVSDGKAI